MKPIVLVVAGPVTLPRIVLDILAVQGRETLGYVQTGDTPWTAPGGMPLLGGEERLDEAAFVAAHELIIAVGNRTARWLSARVQEVGGDPAPVVIHPTASISPSAKIGEGTVISAGVVVQMDATIGRFCVLNTACTIDHDNVLEDAANIAPGAHLAGGARVNEGAFVGIGATISNRVTIGRGAQVGAGAVVIRDVADGVTVVGNPARPLEPVRS